MPRPRDEQCPKRGPGLTHTVDGDITCVHCGQMTTRSVYDMIREVRDSLRKGTVPDEPPEAEDPKDMPPADPPRPGLCQWQRGHIALAVWVVPRDGKCYCREHFDRIVRIALWKGP